MWEIIKGIGVIIEEYISVIPAYQFISVFFASIVALPAIIISKYFFPSSVFLVKAIFAFLIGLLITLFPFLVLAFILRTFFGMKTLLCQHCGQLLRSKWQACKNCGQLSEAKK